MTDQKNNGQVKISEYKGHPIVCIPTEKGWPFRFGKSKAECILNNTGAIQAFVDGETEAPGVEIGEYKGTLVINLPMASGWPFSFGEAKARAVLGHMDSIRQFVAGDLS